MKAQNALFVFVLACSAATAEEGWTRFRGPNGSGVSGVTTLPAQWAEGDYRWKVELPGTGHSSPVVFGQSIYVTSTDPQTAEQSLYCVSNSDGAIRWRIAFPAPLHTLHRFNSFASASPAVDEKHVYFTIASDAHYTLVAVNHQGQVAWRYDLGPFVSQHGSGASPMLYKGMVIQANDQDGPSFVVAMNADDGKLRWKADRKSGLAAYGTPCIYTGPDGHDQLILSSQASGLSGLDPQTGKTLWEMADIYPLRAVCSPVVAGDLVIGTCGEGGGGKRLVAVRPGSFDGTKPASLAYEITEKLPYVPTPLVIGPHMFLLNDGGVATCVEHATGNVLWRERVGGDFFASPVAANGVIYAVARNGDVATFKASDKHQPIARMPLGDASHATPAIANGSMYLRTEKHLFKIGE